MIPKRGQVLQSNRERISENGIRLTIDWECDITTEFYASGGSEGEIKILVEGKKGRSELIFTDSFTAFKSALSDFLYGVKIKQNQSPYSFNKAVVELIEKGRAS